MANKKLSNPYEVIVSNIQTLDDELNSHKDNCLRCIENKKCKTWDDLVETFNFYSLAMRRYVKNTGEYE